jgi:hypothetical protein
VRRKADRQTLTNPLIRHPYRNGLLPLVDFDFNMFDLANASTSANLQLTTPKEWMKRVVHYD